MYYDESLVPLAAEPDASLGRGVARAVAVRHLWVVDEEAVYEERVVAEYPETGGVDVALVEVSPGSGHWETTDASGLPVAYDGPLPPEEMSGLGEVPGTWEVAVWVPWTDGELAERAALAEQEAAAREAFEGRERWIGQAPAEQAAQDDAICAVYEMIGA